jgi:hypothetical protein
MPNTREKLIDLLKQANDELRLRAGCSTWGDFADHLIANGVIISKMETVATDNNKWISVKDRLPEDGENVLVYNDDNSEDFIPYFTGYFHGGMWYSSYALYEEENFLEVPSIVTHWMPLPEPPKDQQHKHFPNGDCK